MKQTNTQEETPNTTPINEGLIEVKIIKQDGDMFLYIKSCRAYEDFLKKKKKTEKIKNFCNIEGLEKEIYNNRIDTNSIEEDSAKRDLIQFSYNNILLNKAVLRIKGISEGVTLPVNRLITKTDLNNLIRNFVKDFIEFYKENLTNYEIGVIITSKNILY